MRTSPGLFGLVVASLLTGCGTTPAVSPLVHAPASGVPADGSLLLAGQLAGTIPAPGFEAGAATVADRGLAALAANGAAHEETAAEAADVCILWNTTARDLAAEAKLPPPLFARVYALEAVAVHDAIALGSARGGGTPARCLAGAAATTILSDLFPAAASRLEDMLAAEVALSAGGDRGAVMRGLALGRVAGRAAVRAAHADGSDAPFTGAAPVGECFWVGTNPVTPTCGSWRTWITTSGAEFQPEPPYECGSAKDLAEVQEVVDAAAARTPEQIAIVHKWADRSPPAIWNGIMNDAVVAHGLSARETARVHAFVNMAIYDAFVSCWRTKYDFWVARPSMRAPGLVTVIPTPNFPSYTSGHSTISAAAAEVLGAAFPDQATYYHDQAAEAALSRFWAGIHFTHDNEQGLLVGARVGGKAAARFRAEGAHDAAHLVATETR